MLQHCLTLNNNNSPSLPNSTGTSTQASPNVAREYSLAFQTHSYKEILSNIQVVSYEEEEENTPVLDRVLYPNRDSVQKALDQAKPNTLTRLVSDYFDHSESTSHLCIRLQRGVVRARALYAPLDELLDLLPNDSDSLSQSHCNWAFDVFLQFDALHNPFPSPDSHNFKQIRLSFSQLKQQLDQRLRKSRSTLRRILCRTFTLSYLTTSVVALAACATTRRNRKRRMAQLDAASKGTYVLNNDLDTIDRLVARLHSAIEGDKLLVRLGLESGRERHPIQEVVKQLRKNHFNFLHQLDDLEQHLCLCFSTVNRARTLLLQEIYLLLGDCSADKGRET